MCGRKFSVKCVCLLAKQMVRSSPMFEGGGVVGVSQTPRVVDHSCTKHPRQVTHLSRYQAG